MADTKDADATRAPGAVARPTGRTKNLAADAEPFAPAAAAAAGKSPTKKRRLTEEEEDELNEAFGVTGPPVAAPVVNAQPEAHELADVTKPIGQFGNIILNGKADLKLMENRARLHYINMQKSNKVPQYPAGSKDCYDIQTRELLFVARPIDGSVLTTPMCDPTKVFSAFNDLPVNHKAVFIGVADTPIRALEGPGSATVTGLVSTAMGGTRTLPCAEPVNPGDTVVWKEPGIVTTSSGARIPATRQKGTPKGKFFATVAPLNYGENRSKNLHATVMALHSGSFAPKENEIWSKISGLQMLMIEVTDTSVKNAKAGKSDEKATSESEALLKKLATLASSDSRKYSVTDIARKIDIETKAPNSLLQKLGKKSPVAILVLMIQEFIAYWYERHKQIWEEKVVGIAMSSGNRGGVDVLVKPRA